MVLLSNDLHNIDLCVYVVVFVFVFEKVAITEMIVIVVFVMTILGILGVVLG